MTDKPAESAVERYCATKADTLFNKYGEAYEVVPRQRADAALTEVQDERDAALKRERVATMFSDAFEDAANGAHWRLEYERGLRHVILSCWQYASRADEAWENGYQKGWLDGEGQYEPLLTKADAALADVVAALAALQAENEALRREVERLKVCGLCCHCVGFAGNTPPSCNSPDTVQDEGAFAHFISDVLTPCHFTPSRWQRRQP